VGSITGQQFLAWFTDLNKDARYIRITITNISEENEIYVDELAIWGGTTTTLRTRSTITGYLGDSIEVDARTGLIDVSFEDTRKKEADNRRLELTLEYKNQRAEQIIYDLLTNPSYWTNAGATGSTKITDGGFESGGLASWPGSTGSIKTKWKRSGTYCVELYPSGELLQQAGIVVVADTEYILFVWYFSPNAAQFHIDLTYDSGAPGRFPTTGSYSVTAVGYNGGYRLAVCRFTAPSGATSVTLKITVDNTSDDFRIDDVSMYTYVALVDTNTYDAPLESDEIGWAFADDLSGFLIPRWQGQQGTVLDYCQELAELIGWVYDSDGDGVRQFWQPEHNRTIASTHLNFFTRRQIGPTPARRIRSGRDVRNHLKIVGYEDKNKEVPREYYHPTSIARYGDRYARITEPLIRTDKAADELAKALLRDFAYAGESLESSILGDWDIDRPYRVYTHHEPIRALLDKSELWCVWSYDTEMIAAGKGSFVGTIGGRKYMSSRPDPVATLAATGGATQIALTWDANSEVDLDGYYVYWATADDPDAWSFTKRAKVTAATDTITGLVNGTAYWMYVTAVNLGGVESEPSAIIRCLAGGGNSGSESDSWGITGMTVALTDNDPDVTLHLAWTPSLTIDPDYISASLLGPSKVNPPTNITEHARLTPADAVVEDYYANYAKATYDSGVTHYWRLGIYEVVINDNHYHFGTPLYSNVPSASWP